MSLNTPLLWFGLLIIFMSTVINGQLESVITMQISDNMINAALKNPRLIQKQLECLMKSGECDAIGNQLKTALPFVLDGKCPGCSEKQHQQANRVVAELSKRFPADYKKVYKMYSNKAKAAEKKKKTSGSKQSKNGSAKKSTSAQKKTPAAASN